MILYREGVVMIKRHKSMTFFVILFVAISGVIGYRYYRNKNAVYSQPKMAPMLSAQESINFLNFEEELLSEDGEYYLWFCDSHDKSCQYVENEYLNPMLTKLKVSEFKDLMKVDFTNCPFSVEKLKNKFNVKSKLSFVKAVVKNGNITYSNALSWVEEDPFSATELKDWLYENNIWQTTYQQINNGN